MQVLKKKQIVASLFVFLAIIFGEHLFRDPLYAYTLEYIPQIQTGATGLQISSWSVYSHVGLVASVAVPFLYSFA